MRPKIFNYGQDINGKKFPYPINQGETVLFFTENRFFIYSLYTKANLTEPLLSEVTLAEYFKIRDALKGDDNNVSEIYAKTVEGIKGIINFTLYNILAQDLTVGDTIDLGLV